MAEKIINGRIINKHDIEANWLKAVNFIPKKGELIIYDIDTTYNYERVKIGDGVHTVNELSFCMEQIAGSTIDEICGMDMEPLIMASLDTYNGEVETV